MAHASIRADSLTSSPSAVDLGSTSGSDLPDVERRSPVEPKRKTTSAAARLLRDRHVGQRAAECRVAAMQLRAAAGFRTGRVDEEERDDAVADVPSDEPAGVDDALVGGACEPADEREVARCR